MSDMSNEEIENDEDSVEVEVEVEEQSAEGDSNVEIIDEPTAPDDGELDNYNKGVQKRIRQLNQRYRDEQNSREEATKIAQKLAAENQQLQHRVQQLDSGYLNEYGNRVQSESAAAESAYLAAADEGNTEAMLAAQKALTRAQYDERRFEAAKQRVDQNAQAAQQAPAQQAQIAQQEQPQVDPRADQWAQKNKWFGEDDVMTASVFAIHKRMVTQEGFDPASEEYYTEVDRRMRSEFPNKFASKKPGGGSQVASAASSASRNTNQKRSKSVRLTQRQVIMAKKLNVPLETYARYVKD